MNNGFVSSNTIRRNQTDSGRRLRVIKPVLVIALFALFFVLCASPSAAHTVSDHPDIAGGWTPVTSTTQLTSIAASGNYYLMNDITLTDTWNITSGKKINLCLNGHVIKQTSEGKSVIKITGQETQLNLYDCGNVKHYFDKDDETGLWTLIEDKRTSDYFVSGGVITGGKSVSSGGGVYVKEGGTFTMSGGNIVGNNAELGAGVMIYRGTFTMSRGNIIGNSAIGSDISNGGGVNCNRDSTFTMFGGNIVGNNAELGAGVYSASSDSIVTMFGGNITGNIAKLGGGVYNHGTFTMNDGSIVGNKARSNGCNVYNIGNFTMSAGSIVNNLVENRDNVYNIGNGIFTMSRDVTVDEIYLAYNYNLSNHGTIRITGNEFTGGASNIIIVNIAAGDTIVEIDEYSSLRAEDILRKFSLKDTSKTLTASADEKKLILSESTQPTPYPTSTPTSTRTPYPTSTPIPTMTPYPTSTPMPTMPPCPTLTPEKVHADHTGWTPVESLADIKISGSYYLKNNVILEDTWQVPSGKNINLCLNGYVIMQTGKEKSVIEISDSGTQLTLYDCSDVKHYFDKDDETGLWTLNETNRGSPYNVTGGVITGGICSDSLSDIAGGVTVDTDGTFVVYGGNIAGSRAKDGGGVYLDYGSTFIMYGGSIAGNTARYGGGVYLDRDSYFDMSGGSIVENTAVGLGGSIHTDTYGYGGGVYSNGVFMMSDGCIYGNNVTSHHGGGVFSDGDFTMSGGSIIGNTAKRDGGGVYLDYSSAFTLLGGNIINNTAGSCGGGVYACHFCKFTMRGGNIAYNTASIGGGIDNSCDLTIFGGNITGNTGKWYGGGVFARSSDIIFNDGNIMNNIAEYGGGVYEDSDCSFIMSGGNIVDNTAKIFGGGVYVYDGTYTMHDGYIINNTAKLSGGGMYVYRNSAYEYGTFVMSGGSIVDNAAGVDGGGVCSYSEVTISGGNIVNNTAGFDGGGVSVSGGGTFEMSGGSVTENVASQGGGVSVSNAVFTMSGKASVNANNEIYLELNNVIGITGTGFTGGAGNITGPQTETDGNTVVKIDKSSSLTASGILNKFALQDKTKKLVASSNGKELNVAQSTPVPTPTPTKTPTPVPTKTPTVVPTKPYTPVPTKTPTVVPTKPYTPVPTKTPTVVPTKPYTPIPTKTPTVVPTKPYTPVPTKTPTVVPTKPYTPIPTKTPTVVPTPTKTPTPAQTPKISGASLSLSTDISVRFYVKDSDLTGYHGEYIEATFNGVKYTLQPTQDPNNPRRMFVFKHISPAEMGDTITAKLYAVKNGETVVREFGEITYSVKDYCMNQINKAGAKNTLTTLCVDLLNYGSASQTYCGETDKSKLVSNGLTATQKSWASTTITPAVRNDQSISGTGSDSVGAWRAASLNLYSDISFICKFTTDTNPSDLTATVTYGKNGENTAVITSFTDSTYSGGACKQIKFNNLNAQELNHPIKIILKNKKTGTVSKTLTYSVDAYSYSKMSEGGDLGNLVTSIMKYIRSVDRFVDDK